MYNKEADVYSLGALVFTLVTRDNPPEEFECDRFGVPVLRELHNEDFRDLLKRMLHPKAKHRITLEGFVLC